MRLILGSGSARRRDILARMGLEPDEIRPPAIDEAPRPGELPRAYCRRIARTKAEALIPAMDEVILCADTTVAVGRRILGKPTDAAQAAAFLRLLSGRRHRVVTAIAVRRGDRILERDVITLVRMKVLSGNELRAYLATGDWQGKAGAYAIQGLAGAFVPWLQGSFGAVVGLPVFETAQLLKSVGLPVPGSTP